MPDPVIDSAAAASEHRFPCAQCGAELRFTPGQTELTCTHCGFAQPIPGAVQRDAAVVEHDYAATLRSLEQRADWAETKVLSCPNCGAQTEFPEGTTAARCPFCDTPVVSADGARRQIRPAGLIPFQLQEEAARAAMRAWLGRLWFAPNALRDYARAGRPMTGIYVPYWTFDAQTETDYRGQRGDDYYETRTVSRNGRTETERVRRTRWRPARGRVRRAFDDIVILAERSLPKRFTDALQPWDLSAVVNYRPEFLAGFAAEAYQVALPEGFAEARGIMDGIIRQDIRRDIGGDHQRIDWLDTRIRDVTFRHLLLPVWVAAYRYRGKTYRFVVNGQTGKVQGERPWSPWKIAVAALLGLILLGALALLLANAEGGTVSFDF